MVFLVLWIPITMHCKLEVLPGFEFLSCCTHADTTPHHEQDCDEDACSEVESGLYFVASLPVWVCAPDVEASLPQTILVVPEPDPVEAVVIHGPAPPDKGWQFAQRVALLPRAPSTSV
jgi:hypothetical protein